MLSHFKDFWGQETDIMGQFLDPETDIMGKRYYIVYAGNQHKYKIKKYRINMTNVQPIN